MPALINPTSRCEVESEERLADVPFQYVWARHLAFEDVFPSGHQTLDAVRSRLATAATDDDGHRHVGQQQVLEEIATQ